MRSVHFIDARLSRFRLRLLTRTPQYQLPQKEFQLLYKLTAYPGQIFTKQQIMDDIWGYESESDQHTVEVHVGKLRERFRDNPDFKIVTIRGVGYKFNDRQENRL